MKKIMLTAACLLITIKALAAGYDLRATFTCYDPVGNLVATDSGYYGTWSGKVGPGQMALYTTEWFYTAIPHFHDIEILGPGTYAIDTGGVL